MQRTTKISILIICVSLLILAAIFWWANPRLLIQTISEADLRYLLLAFAIANLAVLTWVMKWKVLFAPAQRISFGGLFPVQTLGAAISNLTPGKIGEPTKAIILKLYKRTPVSVSLPTIMWERIIDIVILVALGVIGIQRVTGAPRFFLVGIISTCILIAFIVLLFLILYSKSFGARVFSFLRRFPILNRIDRHFLKTFYAQRIFKARLVRCFALTLVTWLLEGIVFYFVLASFGVNLPPLTAVGIFGISILVGIASSLPGGLGSMEAIMIFLLLNIGIGITTATAAVMLTRLLTFGYSLILGYVSFIYLSQKIEFKNILK